MTDYTKSRRVAQLYKQIQNHPQRDELLRLIAEQQADDNYEVLQHMA